MAVPAKHYLDTLRELRGAPKVTYPYGDTAFPRIERVYSVPKGRVVNIETSLADFPNSVRVQLAELKRDQRDVEVYVRYDTLPGPILAGRIMSGDAQGAVASTTTQRLAAGAADYVPTWKTLSYSDTPLDTFTKERSVTTLGDLATAAEISRVITTGTTIPGLSGKYLTLDDINGPVAVWFDVNNLSTNPAPAGHRMIEVNLTATGNERTVIVTTGATAETLDAQYFTMEDVHGPVGVWFDVDDLSAAPAPDGYRMIEVNISAGIAEVSKVDTAGITALALGGTYFSLADTAGPVGVWFDDNNGSTNPAPGGHRMIEVNISSGYAEETEVDFTGLTPAGLDGTYIQFTGPAGAQYFWFDLDNLSVDPAPGGIGMEVDIATGNSTSDIATAFAAVANAAIDFSGSSVSAVATVTHAASGDFTDANAGTSGAAVTITTQGVDSDTAAQIASAIQLALEADASFNASVVGTEVTITDIAFGARTNIAAATTGFAVTTITNGVPTATAATIATSIAAALDADAQFTASVTATNTVTANDVATGPRTDSAAGATGLTVSSSTIGEASAATQEAAIATALAAALDADAQFAASVTATNTVQITDAATGPRQDINAGSSGFTVSVVTQGGTATDFPILTDYDQDQETLALITTTVQVVEASAVTAPLRTVGRITRFQHIDKWRSLKIVEVYATPAGYSEQRFGAQNFPNLFRSFFNSNACGTILDMRAGFSAMVASRLDISYGPRQTVTGLTLIPNSFSISAFRVNDVLNDAIRLRSSNIGCNFNITLPASKPSASAYTAMIGRYQLITGESVLWKAGLYRTSRLYVRMQ